MPPKTRRIRLWLAFDGALFEGWQSQPSGKTVQDVLEKALAQLTQETIRVEGCSRTDSGVHAERYAAHFDTQSQIPLYGLVAGTNSLLPKTVAVLKAEVVPKRFHARKSAKSKTYRYMVFNSAVRDPLRTGRVWQVSDPLNVAAMKRAAAILKGRHDFSCFQAADPEPRPAVRTLDVCRVTAHKLRPPYSGQEVFIEVKAKGFLKYMVRNIAGTLVEVGRGKRSAGSMKELLKSRDRTQAGMTAPAGGLTLVELRY